MAVTYYNQTVLGGTSYPRYADPLVTGKSNADGLYPWSTVRARFATYSGSVVDATTSLDSETGAVHVLLFTSDIPAVGYIAAAAAGVPNRPLAPSAQVGTTGTSAFFKATPAGTDVIVAAGQVGVGYVYNAAATTTANQNIYAAGFPAELGLPSVTPLANAELWLWANSPNICSPVSFQNWDAQAGLTTEAERLASGALPIILLYSQYTQAIRDAGNTIVNTAAPIGSTYQVVGLYSQGTTPAP
jgi:hypothetical protein